MPLSAEAERRAVSPDRTVSVIIPARNERRTIARLIHAIQQQAPAGWGVEVVLVDDGSTDDTVSRRARGWCACPRARAAARAAAIRR